MKTLIIILLTTVSCFSQSTDLDKLSLATQDVENAQLSLIIYQDTLITTLYQALIECTQSGDLIDSYFEHLEVQIVKLFNIENKLDIKNSLNNKLRSKLE